MYRPDGRRGANLGTFAAEAAFVVVDIGQVVAYLDCLERAHLYTFRTTYAGRLTRFAGRCSFLLIDALYIDTARFGSLFP